MTTPLLHAALLLTLLPLSLSAPLRLPHAVPASRTAVSACTDWTTNYEAYWAQFPQCHAGSGTAECCELYDLMDKSIRIFASELNCVVTDLDYYKLLFDAHCAAAPPAAPAPPPPGSNRPGEPEPAPGFDDGNNGGGGGSGGGGGGGGGGVLIIDPTNPTYDDGNNGGTGPSSGGSQPGYDDGNNGGTGPSSGGGSHPGFDDGNNGGTGPSSGGGSHPGYDDGNNGGTGPSSGGGSHPGFDDGNNGGTGPSSGGSSGGGSSGGGSSDGPGASNDDNNNTGGTVDDDDDDSRPIRVERACFPASSTLQLASGLTKRMDELQIGDRVQVRPGVYSEVFLFTHRDAGATARYVRLVTTAGTLVATRGHYVHTGRGLVPAGAVRVGDEMMSAGGDATAVVRREMFVAREGLFNPQTLQGDIVVDGLRVSTYTMAVEPSSAHALLAPLRALHSLAHLWRGASCASVRRGAVPEGISAMV